MGDRPISDAIKQIEIPDLPADSVTVAVEEKPGGDVGATLSGNVDFDIGKKGGWTGNTGVSASWWRSTGTAVKAWFTLKK
jgi:hypothetical protein